MLHNVCLLTYTHLLSKEKRGDNRRCVDCSFFLDCTHSSRVMPYLHSSVFSSSGDGASFTFLQYNQNNKLSWRFVSSGMWCWTVPGVSESHAFIVRISSTNSLGLLDPENKRCAVQTTWDGRRGVTAGIVTFHRSTQVCECVCACMCVYNKNTISDTMTWWTETFLKPNGGTFKEFRKLKNVLHLACACAHTHTHTHTIH